MKAEDFEGIAIAACALLFIVWERLRPARDIRHRDDWRRDAVAILVLVIGVNLSRFVLQHTYTAVDLRGAVAAAPWHRWPLGAQVLLAALLADFSLYWTHRLMHTRWFWRAHRFHHSAEQLYWLSGFRTSVVHGFLFAVPQVAIAFYLFDFTPTTLGLLFAGGVFVQFWTHANVRASLGPLDWLFVTPRSHRVHHAVAEGLEHGNYGTTLSIWDRLFGTYVDPRRLPDDHALGLGERGSTARMAAGI